MIKFFPFFSALIILSMPLYALDFMESEDEKLLLEMEKADKSINFSELEESDDLQSLREDIGDLEEVKIDDVLHEIDKDKLKTILLVDDNMGSNKKELKVFLK